MAPLGDNLRTACGSNNNSVELIIIRIRPDQNLFSGSECIHLGSGSNPYVFAENYHPKFKECQTVLHAIEQPA